MRMLIAGFLGGVILMVWSWLAWTVLPLHSPSLRALPNESATLAALRDVQIESGAYAFPYTPEDDQGATPEEKLTAFEAWEERHHEGPVGFLVYDADGAEPLPPKMFATGFIVYVVLAMLAAALLTLANLRNYVARVVFVLGLAFVVILASDLAYWNWMRFPTDFTVASIVDRVIGWLAMALVVAAIVKPKAA